MAPFQLAPTGPPLRNSKRPEAALGRNNMIDGWRGVSVSLVIVGHFIEHRFSEAFVQTPFRAFIAEGLHAGNAWPFVSNILARLLAPLPTLGVDIFFLISGFLITSLLIKEEGENGRVSVSAFYARRAFRILPAFYAYLLAIFALGHFGFIEAPLLDIAKSGLFLCSLPGAQCDWWVGHAWSLAVEEQFYLVFPVAFIFLRRWRVIALAAAVVGLCLLYFAFPRALSFAHIMFGALIAASPAMKDALTRVAGPRVIIACAAIVVAQPFFDSLPIYPFVNAARPLLIGVIFFGTLNAVGPFVRLVSAEAFQKIGLVSYSLYLWQQLSTADVARYDAFPAGLIPVLFIVPALASYAFIERPLIAVGRRLSANLTRRSQDPRAAPLAGAAG